MLKYYIIESPTIYENFKPVFFNLSSSNENLETYMQVWFE